MPSKKFTDYPASFSSASCITLGACRPLRWLEIFNSEYCKSNVSPEHDTVFCGSKPEYQRLDNKAADESMIDTIIKYTDEASEFSITITIFFNTGSINIQGKKRSLDTWLQDHYPRLCKLYTNTDVTGPICVDEHPTSNTTTTKSDVSSETQNQTPNTKKSTNITDDDDRDTTAVQKLFQSSENTSSPHQKALMALKNCSFQPRKLTNEARDGRGTSPKRDSTITPPTDGVDTDDSKCSVTAISSEF